ncbi:MAG: hypothetical protein MI725_01825 [Pirellulales bacterium]|nr:hypothetical protein [Pirellulales bacterium]
MATLTLEEIKKQYEGPARERVYLWFIPKASRFWERPRWVDVTDALAPLTDEQLAQKVEETNNLYFASMVPLTDRSFDRFLRREVRKRKARKRLMAVYRPDRHIGPSPLFDATVFGLVMVLGAANMFV